MNQSRSPKVWLRQVRALRDAGVRRDTGHCYVEGIRQVLAAREGVHPIEAILIDPRRLRSDVAWQAVQEMRTMGAAVVELAQAEFERISSRDNPTGIAAIVQWRPTALADMTPLDNALYLVTDSVGDAGNLGTLIRTADSMGSAGVIVHGGADPTHPNALRASLGAAFRLPIASATALDEVFAWTAMNHVMTVATSARADQAIWEVPMSRSVAIFVGSEGTGLDGSTIARCDETVLIPISGTVTSLNVGVAAGIALYEVQRQRAQGC